MAIYTGDSVRMAEGLLRRLDVNGVAELTSRTSP